MNVLLRPMSPRGLQGAMTVFVLFAAGFVVLFYGLEHSITILAKASVPEAYRRGFDSEIRLLRLTTTGTALCSLALGACVASIFFLWRAASERGNSHSLPQMKQG